LRKAIVRASALTAPETVPLFDPGTPRCVVARRAQPIDAIVHLTSAVTTSRSMRVPRGGGDHVPLARGARAIERAGRRRSEMR